MSTCRYLSNRGNSCEYKPIVLIPYGFGNIGACAKHVSQVVLWAMNASRTELPSRPVVVIPVGLWDNYPSLHEGV